MSQRNRDDYFNYTKPGEFEFLEIPCEKCKYNQLKSPEVCKKYPTGKPIRVLSAEEDCPEFKEAKAGVWKKYFPHLFRFGKK